MNSDHIAQQCIAMLKMYIHQIYVQLFLMPKTVEQLPQTLLIHILYVMRIGTVASSSIKSPYWAWLPSVTHGNCLKGWFSPF